MPEITQSKGFVRHRFFPGLLVFLFFSAAYLYPFPQPNLVYPVVVLLHVAAGIVVTVLLLIYLWELLRRGNLVSRLGWLFLAAGGILGCVLIKTGTVTSELNLLYVHIGLCLAGVGLVFSDWLGRRGWLRSGPLVAALRTAVCLLVLAGLAAGAQYFRTARWLESARIQNPPDSPPTMDQEGDGAKGPFFPSSAQVYGGEKIPSKFFMESDSCKRCHEDIYKEWFSSAHHFSSFNNQWYRKSVEYMQDTIGTKPSKWCGGCHDPAVLYAGKMDRPIKEFVHSPEAQAGLGCMMCHSIAKVKSTMGQADFYLEYPKLHALAASKNPVIRSLHDFLVYLNPEPHRRVFLKPFMRDQTAQFCAACHKVHLDVPVNHYRWVRGFNEYDNWQASGVSGLGARSFYYPAKPAQCADCHMPLVRSTDQGNLNGYIHSHRFPAANTALPTANEDAEQLKVVEDFLKNDILSVDIFALAPEPTPLKVKANAYSPSELSTTFAVGEESESKITPVNVGEVAPVTAPLDRTQPVVRRGDNVRVDVVVRTKKIGHFFPGGTVDAFDVWLELKGTDDKGQTVFWSGEVEDDGHGPVEPGAHFYKSLQVDEHGNPINKRNAWATRSVVYVHLIPPGAADTVHYRMHIPEKAGDKITLHARLCYRKFSWWNTQFAFAGVPDPNQNPKPQVTPDFDDTRFVFSGSLQGVSAKEQKIPDLPIVALGEDKVTLAVAPANVPLPKPKVVIEKDDWHRWNDYGIGLLLQGDLKAAQAAFVQATEADPNNPDGWVNIGRTAVQEGDMERARTVIQKALALSPNLARAHYVYSRVLLSDGRYGESAAQLEKALAQYPYDRVVLNDLGHVYFLQRKYTEAVQTLKRVLAIDPEDLEAHYNLMLCYKGLGDKKDAHAHEVRYLRFKANEAAQAITGPYRQTHPFDNNERQAIHEHLSVPLPVLSPAYSEKLDMPKAASGYSSSAHSTQHKRRNLAYSNPSAPPGVSR